jgi:hypothetical protein
MQKQWGMSDYLKSLPAITQAACVNSAKWNHHHGAAPSFDAPRQLHEKL